jgi:rhamnosyltransferase
MQIAAAVILYHPDKKAIDNILSYSAFVNTLYAFDNTESPDADFRALIKTISNCNYFHDGVNEGIAKRLNQACQIAKEEGFLWLLTMDQDSYFSKADISSYLSCLNRVDAKEQIAMTGVQINKEANKEINCGFEEVTTLITSGSIVNLSLYREIGTFDEALFIDQVDLEYCYRAVLKGYKIIQFTNISLEHSLGISSVHRSLKSFKNTYRSLHSPIRIYYITRNYLYVHSKYRKKFAAEVAKSKKDLFIRLKNNLLYGKEKFAVVKYFLRGVIDFKKKKMGKV